MRATFILRQYVCRVTLFTRENCSLCDDAKQVLKKVWERRPYEYDEVNVMAAAKEKWKAVYEFDTPVIHVDKTKENNQKFQTSTEALKLMHRFREDQVDELLDQAMQRPSSP
ncbi:hypothetical protein C1H76_3936 [Elsinoe australis]|uniref:Glutaredoxin-like protein n=1 Tax=Elsinoe australis TaxID=40998 RepID=A0A4U7AZ26_9PEZI|nr:hypothetical protein C1H76_3936 [Elsinoe australis]